MAGKGGRGGSGVPRALAGPWLLAALGKDCCFEPSPATPQALAEPGEVACGEELGTCATGVMLRPRVASNSWSEMSSIHGGVPNMFALDSRRSSSRECSSRIGADS